MGRPATIFVEPLRLLRGIHNAVQTKRKRLLSAIATAEATAAESRAYCDQRAISDLQFQLRDLDDYGIEYRVEDFAGRVLSSSEKIRWQQATRALEVKGLVEVLGVRGHHVKVTPAGLAKLGIKPVVEVGREGTAGSTISVAASPGEATGGPNE